MNTQKCKYYSLTAIMLLVGFFNCAKSIAQTYPFTLPATVTAMLDVDTTVKENANNKLLGYNYWAFKTSNDKALARIFNPVSVRFSEGNFYNWETDGFNDDSYDNTTYQSILDQYIRSNTKWGYPNMLSMNKELKAKYGHSFDVIFDFSVGFADAASNIRRLKKYDADGLNITDVELGNEYFWDFFRNNATAQPSDQLILFKQNADSLHKAKPGIKVSIPLGWRTNQNGYNTTIMGDKKYYDAISIHKYVGADPDIPGQSDVAYSSLLTSRLSLTKDVDYVRNQAPGKPVWLTEWNVDGAASGQWAAALGATDIYLYLYNNQNIYQRSCWFSAAAAKNPLVLMDPVNKYTPKYPFEKTISGAMYEIVRGVFEDAQLYKSTITTSKLTTSLGSIDAVNARMVMENGKKEILAVNLTDKTVDFVLKINGNSYNNTFSHAAMSNSRMDATFTMAIDKNPLELVKKGTGAITLPPLSINVISLENDVATSIKGNVISKNNLTVSPNPSINGVFTLSKKTTWEVFNLQGQKQTSGKGTLVDLSQLPKGVYVLKSFDGILKLVSQ